MRDRARSAAASFSLALAVLLAACTASTPGSAQPSVATDADFAITSQDLKFTNLEAAPHNVAIYRDSSAADDLFVGDVISSSSVVYQVPALEAGSYFFRCDVHPDMDGTLVAG